MSVWLYQNNIGLIVKFYLKWSPVWDFYFKNSSSWAVKKTSSDQTRPGNNRKNETLPSLVEQRGEFCFYYSTWAGEMVFV